MVTEDRLAYVAGVLDGDGYVSIMKSRLPDPWQPYFQAKIGVAQLWPGTALRVIHDSLGGRIFGPIERNGGRPIARWEIWNARAVSILTRLIPHLRVKRPQALLLIEAQHLQEGKLPAGVRKARMERFRLAIMNLNRGVGEYKSLQREHPPPAADEDFRHRDEDSGSVLPYLAGIMDSDGNFKIEKRSVKRMVNPHYRIALRAAQVAPSPAIELLARTFGGSVRIKRSGSANHRPLASWSLHDRSAKPAIEALLPYLTIKAPEARLLLRLRELKAQGKKATTTWTHPNRWHRAVKMRKRCYSPNQVQEFERLYLTLRALHSGVAPLNLPGFPEPSHGALTTEEQALLLSP